MPDFPRPEGSVDSKPPPGKYEVVNVYYDAELDKYVMERKDEPEGE